MKNLLIVICALIPCFGYFAQVKTSVDELKNAQSIRQKYIGADQHDVELKVSKTYYVDPFIGTGGHGHTYPGASAPFGIMQLSPDTRFDGWDGCSGYHYSDSIIYGFSHTHLSGTGVPDYCDLLIVPQSGSAKIKPGYSHKDGYGDEFSHTSEKASPGYYEVMLLNQHINVRLVAGDRSGIHEYTFQNKNDKKFILIDLDHRDKVLDAEIKINNKKSISGFRTSQSWATEQHFYFQLETNIPYKDAKIITKDNQHKLLLEFPIETEKIMVKVGISAADNAGAKANLDKEIPGWDMNALRAQTVKKWNEELEKIDFYSDDKEVMIKFYTSLYHSFLNPNLFSDSDGRYRGRDNTIHSLTGNDKQYSVFSLWDTYRGTHPLFTITQQQRTNEFIRTFLRQYDEGGDLPVWELAGNETECMIGYHSVSVIADAFTKKIVGFDAEKALKAMIATSNFNEYGKVSFNKNGFISLSDEPESVSKALEYSYDQFCISQVASAIGDKANQTHYELGSLNFINNFDPRTKFMRARRSGLWYSPFDPTEVNFNYTEANSWQYSLYAPHAVGVLRDLLGGKDSLSIWLDRLFTTKSSLSGRNQADITGLIGQYAHGNEPSHHIAYLYNYTNTPHKTQWYVDKILREMYSIQPDGLSGNEDCGQMSSWYVLSALGLYQIAPGNPYYDFGRCLAKNASLQLENGKKFTISTINNSNENKYIQKIILNSKEIERLYISHSEIVEGGELIFEMGNSPNSAVDSYDHAPTISKVPANFTPIPYFEQENRTFSDSMKVSINYPHLQNNTFSIKYTLDGTDPTVKSTDYSTPIKLSKSTLIRTALFNITSQTMGSAVENEFIKRDATISLELNSTYSNQYAAGGKNALIDGIKGGNEFRTGDWQGFEGQDLIAEISFLEPRILSEIGLSCIQDTKSWIFFPQSVAYEISTDGITFKPLTTAVNVSNNVGKPNANWVFTSQTNTKEPIRKIRVIGKSTGKCPKGHLGEGFDSWLFADEIILR